MEQTFEKQGKFEEFWKLVEQDMDEEQSKSEELDKRNTEAKQWLLGELGRCKEQVEQVEQEEQVEQGKQQMEVEEQEGMEEQVEREAMEVQHELEDNGKMGRQESWRPSTRGSC